MNSYIQISQINDFLFCPYSIYLSSIYRKFNQRVYHSESQVIGKIAHENIESGNYTTSKHVLQGTSVFSEKYGLVGKIDVFDVKKRELVERKYRVKKVFDGYKYQLYAQMFCLEEMGYNVQLLAIQSLSDNKRYRISAPGSKERAEFSSLIDKIRGFRPSDNFERNNNKCERCIYKSLCF